MEFEIEREPFLKVLARIQSVVERRNTMAILGNALLEVDGEILTISATDLEVSLRTRCPARTMQGGMLTVSARKLYDIVKELSEDRIHIRQEPDERLTLTCGTARFTLMGLPGEDFPEIPSADDALKLTLDASTIAEMLSKTFFAISMDETRFNLNGVFLQVRPQEDDPQSGEGGKRALPLLRMVATDTHRLAMVDRDLPITDLESHEVIIPRKAVAEARKILDEGEDEGVELMLGENYIQFSQTNRVLISKLVSGRYPNYQRVIPSANDKILTAERKVLQSAVRRMAVLSNEKSRGVRFQLDRDRIKISTNNPEQEAAEEEVGATYDAASINIGFNARYLLDLLQVIEEDVIEFHLRDDSSPVLVRGTGNLQNTFVLMPMRV
ncbi:DNA polymerase III subunit beta [Magnetococcales bacterium HHB-1]